MPRNMSEVCARPKPIQLTQRIHGDVETCRIATICLQKAPFHNLGVSSCIRLTGRLLTPLTHRQDTPTNERHAFDRLR